MQETGEEKNNRKGISITSPIGAVLVTLGIVVVVELFRRFIGDMPDPDALFLLAIAYAGFVGGLGAGLVSAVIVIIYGGYYFSESNPSLVQYLQYSNENVLRVMQLVLVAPALAVMVGLLKLRATRVSQQKLEQEQGYSASMVASMQDGLIARGPNDRLIEVNRSFCEMTGYTREELMAEGPPYSYWPEEEVGHIRSMYEKYKNGEPSEYEVVFKRKNGERFPVIFSAAPLHVQGERHTGYVATVKEVTERKRIEEALQQSESRMRAIVNTAVEGIITIDEHGIVESMNPAAEGMFGYGAAEVIGRNVSMLMPEPYRHEHDQYLRNYLTTGVKKIIGIGREVEGRRKDGTTFPMYLAVSEMKQGDKRMFAGIVRDITERKRHTEMLHSAIEALEAANHAKDQFLAMLSHELRTPLMPVLATLTVMEDDSVPGEWQGQVEMMRRNVDLEARLIDDLLDLTRISKGKLQLSMGTVDVHASLEDALRICQGDIEAKGLKVHVHLDAHAYHVCGDVARLQQVFWNLLKNAVKFTPAGGKITVRTWNGERGEGQAAGSDRVSLHPDCGVEMEDAGKGAKRSSAESPVLAVEVSDSGIGIAPDVLPRIFEAFEQGEKGIGQRFGGLGLGLSISRVLVGLHGGELKAASEGKGHGARFTVELKTVKAVRSRPPVMPTFHEHEGHKDIRILVVDDHADTSKTMKWLLERLGYRVKTAESVSSALEAVKGERFNLLISDIGLPDGSGLELLRRIQERGPIKAIALSGFGMEEDVRKSKEAGFAEHLTKPVNFNVLKNIVREMTAEAGQGNRE